MKILAAVAFFVLVIIGSLWVYAHTSAPSWCDGWMKYDRSCSGWTFFGEDQ